MLVLTRKPDESIVIDGHITIKILCVKGNRIRIGIDAPRGIPIRRKKLEPLRTENPSNDARFPQPV
jgi:carbon storage regulator